VSAPRRSLASLPLGIEAVVRGVHSVRPVARRLMEQGVTDRFEVAKRLGVPVHDGPTGRRIG
jgi:hypothetical protein